MATVRVPGAAAVPGGRRLRTAPASVAESCLKYAYSNTMIRPAAADGAGYRLAQRTYVQAELRADLSEPVYGESPWEAIYELPLKRTDGAEVLWIRLDHEDEELRGELDPRQFGKG